MGNYRLTRRRPFRAELHPTWPSWRERPTILPIWGVAFGFRGLIEKVRLMHSDLPEDLAAFLAAEKQLEYDPKDCDAGAVTLLPLNKLALELFPMYTDSDSMTMADLNRDDPHRGEDGYYLVEGVNLIGSCAAYEPCGLLMWLPQEKCYGIWDSDHWHITAFSPEHTWSAIVTDPALYLNSGWGDLIHEWPPARPVIPWTKYRYSKQKGGGPFPYTQPG